MSNIFGLSEHCSSRLHTLCPYVRNIGSLEASLLANAKRANISYNT